MAGLGWRLARDEHDKARRRLQELLLVRLQDTSQVLSGRINRLEREMQILTESVTEDHDSIRRLIRQSPHVDQLFVLNADGSLFHPNPRGPLNVDERRFLSDYGDLFLHNDLRRSMQEGDTGGAAPSKGWIVHFQGPGLQLIYYQRIPSGRLVGVHLQRARWMADLIADLPETSSAAQADKGGLTDTRIRLVDSNGQPIYEWGALNPDKGSAPLQELAPSYPLTSWRLQHFVDSRAFAAVGRGSYFNLLSILAAAGLVLVFGGMWFLREYNRNLRESMQRVSFVNQVSHELKTPLTNIRMYAELLENDLEDATDDRATSLRGQLKVIVEESQRLSRLIGNVLTFAKGQRDRLSLRFRQAVIDEVITTVIQHFEPTLQRRGIEVVFRPSAGDLVRVDGDALEQILGNLLSNVEKYASSGRRVEITSSRSGGDTMISICDHGPGIPRRQLGRIFRPFQRLSNHISDSPGTGIGLTIARQLARLHGGDLYAVPSDNGARFELRLHTPSCESEAPN